MFKISQEVKIIYNLRIHGHVHPHLHQFLEIFVMIFLLD